MYAVRTKSGRVIGRYATQAEAERACRTARSPAARVFEFRFLRGGLPPMVFYTKRGLDYWLRKNKPAARSFEIIERPPQRGVEETAIREGRGNDGWLWKLSSPGQPGPQKRFGISIIAPFPGSTKSGGSTSTLSEAVAKAKHDLRGHPTGTSAAIEDTHSRHIVWRINAPMGDGFHGAFTGAVYDKARSPVRGDYEAMILSEQEENDGEWGGGTGSEKARGPRCQRCHYVFLTPSEMRMHGTTYPCNCRSGRQGSPVRGAARAHLLKVHADVSRRLYAKSPAVDSRILLKKAERIMDGLQSVRIRAAYPNAPPSARVALIKYAEKHLPMMQALAAEVPRSDDPGLAHYFEGYLTRLTRALNP